MDDTTPQPDAQKQLPSLSHFREYVTATLAGLVVLGSLLAFGYAIIYAAQSSDPFAQIKEVLNLLMPILTFVLGYYFNKATSETRAEKAEATISAATATATHATNEAQQAKKESAQIAESLDELGMAAQAMMAESEHAAPKGPGVLGIHDDDDEGAGSSMSPAQYELKNALKRAKRIRNW